MDPPASTDQLVHEQEEIGLGGFTDDVGPDNARGAAAEALNNVEGTAPASSDLQVLHLGPVWIQQRMKLSCHLALCTLCCQRCSQGWRRSSLGKKTSWLTHAT